MLCCWLKRSLYNFSMCGIRIPMFSGWYMYYLDQTFICCISKNNTKSAHNGDGLPLSLLKNWRLVAIWTSSSKQQINTIENSKEIFSFLSYAFRHLGYNKRLMLLLCSSKCIVSTYDNHDLYSHTQCGSRSIVRIVLIVHDCNFQFNCALSIHGLGMMCTDIVVFLLPVLSASFSNIWGVVYLKKLKWWKSINQLLFCEKQCIRYSMDPPREILCKLLIIIMWRYRYALCR